MLTRKLSAIAVGFSTLVLSERTLASGFSTQTFGAEHGTPTTTDPTAIFYNPAGIGDSYGGHVYVDGTLALRHSSFDRAEANAPVPPGGEGANTGRGSLTNFGVVPFIGATYRYRPITLGLAWFTPFGGIDSWKKNDAFAGNTQFPGAVDGPQRWYSIEGKLISSFWSLAAAYAFGPVTVGLVGNLVQTRVDTVRARDPTGSDDLRNEGRSWLDATSWDLSAGLGVAFEPSPKWRIGASYQTRPNINGSIRATGNLRTAFAGGRVDDNPADLLTDLPDSFRAGVEFRPKSHIQLRLWAVYERWSALKNQCVVSRDAQCNINPDGSANPEVLLNEVRDWRDAVQIRLSGSYFVRRSLELIAGVGYQSSAVPAHTLDPALPDFDMLSFALGGGLRLGDHWRLHATYTQLLYFTRNTVGKADQFSLELPSRSPDADAVFKQWISLLNANVEFAF